MATAYHNLSEYDFNSVPNAENMKFGIVVSEWNFNITGALLNGAVNTLKKHGVKDENILVKTVPGSFELGKYDDAVNAYTKIKDKYFQSYQAMDIDKYIEQAKLMKK